CENDDAEQRGRERKVAGQAVGRVLRRPIADERDDVGEAEQDGLEGEEVGEDREKERSPESWQGRRRRQRGGEADQERHAVLFIGPDDEGEGGEDGEA